MILLDFAFYEEKKEMDKNKEFVLASF